MWSDLELPIMLLAPGVLCLHGCKSCGGGGAGGVTGGSELIPRISATESCHTQRPRAHADVATSATAETHVQMHTELQANACTHGLWGPAKQSLPGSGGEGQTSQACPLLGSLSPLYR